jgi:Ca2+-transporting ATPase
MNSHEHGDAVVIIGVVVLNTLLGFFQEWRAEGALKALREMGAQHAHVLRAGKAMEIEASHAVPGDVLLLETGDRVAADARVILVSAPSMTGVRQM